MMKNFNHSYSRIKKIIKLEENWLNDSKTIKRAIWRIKAEVGTAAVVVSAPHRTTNLLLQAYHNSLSQARSFDGVLAALKKEQSQVAAALLTAPHLAQLQESWQPIFDDLQQTLQRIFLTATTFPWLKAKILTTGEKLAAHLLAAALQEAGEKAKVFEADEPVLSDGDEAEKELAQLISQPEKFSGRLEKIAEEIDAGDFIPVFAGFFTHSTEGKNTLLGQETSDLKAETLAKALKAQSLKVIKEAKFFSYAAPTNLNF